MKNKTTEMRRGSGQGCPQSDADALTSLFSQAADLAIAHRLGADRGGRRPTASATDLRDRFKIELPEKGRAPMDVIAALVEAAEPGLVGNTRPGFFGWVMGSSHPAGVAADFLTSAWGQNAAIYATSPAAAIAEEAVESWLIDLLRLPEQSAVGFVTGATMGNFTCLAAARGEVLRRFGYDLDADGLAGAPPISVFVGDEAHATVHSALRYLGFGRKNVIEIASDSAGRMRIDDLNRKLPLYGGPKIIIGQAGHINSGAFDPIPEMAEAAELDAAWLHVDGAFGLWARAVPEFDRLSAGIEFADSWSVDGHKWLQVPYDSGFAIVKCRNALRRAMDTTASYLPERPEDGRNPTHFGPELSRRARGFAPWAVLQTLGRKGVADLVRRHCALARHLQSRLVGAPGIRVLNEVFLNQVAIGFEDPDLRVDTVSLTRRVVDELKRDGTSFVEPAEWKGRPVLRVSVISGDTDVEDIDRLADAIIRARGLVGADAVA